MNETADLPIGEVVFEGVPFPRDGAVFGWLPDGATIAGVICCYAQEDPPVFSSMPRTDSTWPDWTQIVRPRFGWWFWDLYRSGFVVDLMPLIGASEDTVFWVDTRDSIGSSCLAVERDLHSPGGWTFPSGAYVYHEVIRDGVAPSLSDLLSDPRAIDLGPRCEGA